MTEIILTPAQTQQFSQATDGVVFCDAVGNVIVRVPAKFSEDESTIIEEAKRRLASDQPRRPFSEVVNRLKAMEQEGEKHGR
jgi:hypothetical protein